MYLSICLFNKSQGREGKQKLGRRTQKKKGKMAKIKFTDKRGSFGACALQPQSENGIIQKKSVEKRDLKGLQR